MTSDGFTSPAGPSSDEDTTFSDTTSLDATADADSKGGAVWDAAAQVPDGDSRSSGGSDAAPAGQTQWWQQWWFIILCFLFFWPAGIALLWLSPVPKKGARVAVTAIAVVVPLVIAWAGIASLNRLSDAITGTHDESGAVSAAQREMDTDSIDDQLPSAALNRPDIVAGQRVSYQYGGEGIVSGYLVEDGFVRAVQVTNTRDSSAINARSLTALEGVAYSIDGIDVTPSDAREFLEQSGVTGATVHVSEWILENRGGELYFSVLVLLTVPPSDSQATQYGSSGSSDFNPESAETSCWHDTSAGTGCLQLRAAGGEVR